MVIIQINGFHPENLPVTGKNQLAVLFLLLAHQPLESDIRSLNNILLKVSHFLLVHDTQVV